jgi:hypothetical protein
MVKNSETKERQVAVRRSAPKQKRKAKKKGWYKFKRKCSPFDLGLLESLCLCTGLGSSLGNRQTALMTRC